MEGISTFESASVQCKRSGTQEQVLTRLKAMTQVKACKKMGEATGWFKITFFKPMNRTEAEAFKTEVAKFAIVCYNRPRQPTKARVS